MTTAENIKTSAEEAIGKYNEADFKADTEFLLPSIVASIVNVDQEWKCQVCGKPYDESQGYCLGGGMGNGTLSFFATHDACAAKLPEQPLADVLMTDVDSFYSAGQAIISLALQFFKAHDKLPIIMRPTRRSMLSGHYSPTIVCKDDKGNIDVVPCYMPIYDTDPAIISGRMAREALALTKAVKAGKVEIMGDLGPTPMLPPMLMATPEVIAEIFAEGVKSA